jgi:hypothetical protein
LRQQIARPSFGFGGEIHARVKNLLETKDLLEILILNPNNK